MVCQSAWDGRYLNCEFTHKVIGLKEPGRSPRDERTQGLKSPMIGKSPGVGAGLALGSSQSVRKHIHEGLSMRFRRSMSSCIFRQTERKWLRSSLMAVSIGLQCPVDPLEKEINLLFYQRYILIEQFG